MKILRFSIRFFFIFLITSALYGIIESPFKDSLFFSGEWWHIFSNYDSLSNNFFDKRMAYVDSSGYLHLLAIRERSTQGTRFYSAGIKSSRKKSFGIYRIEVIGRINNLLNTCFAPFLYDWDMGIYEIDIEFSKWGNPLHLGGNYSVHSWRPKHIRKGITFKPFNDYKIQDPVVSIHYIYLYPDSIKFKSSIPVYVLPESLQKTIKNQQEIIISKWKITDKNFIPQHRGLYPEVYLWWPVKKNTGPDTVEIIVKKFEYIPFKDN